MNINRELLEKQFTGKELKTRKGNFGESIDYVETQLIIQRLNDAFDQEWSFKVIEHIQTETAVIVLGEIYTSGITKQQFGTSRITVNKKTGELISIGDDLKAAASDSLKKCASMLGIALHVYGDSLPDQIKTETIQTANGPVELPLDDEPEGQIDIYKTDREAYLAADIIKNMTEAERQAWEIKYIKKLSKDFNMYNWKKAAELAKIQSNPMKFTETETPPPPAQDEPRLQRISKAYFASLPEFLKDDASRHKWQLKNIGYESTKDWTEFHFEKALDLIDILRKEDVDPDSKIQVPELDASTYENNGGSKPATPSQLKYIQKLLDKKGYYVKGDNTEWTIGKASVLINFLTEQ